MDNGIVSKEVEQVETLARQALEWLTSRGLEFTVSVFVSILILLVGWLVISLLKKATARIFKDRSEKSPILAKFAVSAVSKISWTFLIVMVLAKLGVNVGPLIAGLGVTGFILGFAFQESLSNLAAGLMIAINGPFKTGDFVKAAGFEGVVQEVNMMATVLTTPDNQRIVIPNKSVWGTPITNFTMMKERRVDISVGIAYGADIGEARKVAVETMRAIPGVLQTPAPVAQVVSLSDSSVALSVRVWAETANYWDVFFAGNQAVKEAFARAGIEIPFPQVSVHLDK